MYVSSPVLDVTVHVRYVNYRSTWHGCLVYICFAALCVSATVMHWSVPVWLVGNNDAMMHDTAAASDAGGAIFVIILAALILLTVTALGGFIIHSKWKNSYVRWGCAFSL